MMNKGIQAMSTIFKNDTNNVELDTICSFGFQKSKKSANALGKKLQFTKKSVKKVSFCVEKCQRMSTKNCKRHGLFRLNKNNLGY